MIIVFISTAISCFIFDLINIKETSLKLISSYRELPGVLSDKNINDDERQKKLIDLSVFQVKFLLILSFKIIVFLTPFLSFFLFEIDFYLLFEPKYILSSIMGFVTYILFKKLYEKVFKIK